MTHWSRHTQQWGLVRPPLRPAPEVVECFQALVGDAAARVLVLGVTVELVSAFENVLAIDKNTAVIAAQWPGDRPGSTVRCGDWLALDADCLGAFDAVVGDGSLTALDPASDAPRLLASAFAALKPGGRFACRLFERPAQPFSPERIRSASAATQSLNFHALKWQIAMMLAEEQGAQVPVAAILTAFDEIFPDRDRLARERGWPRAEIDTIDVYRGSPLTYLFPNRTDVRRWLPAGAMDVRFIDCGCYPLAECCPILSFRKAA